MTAANHPDVAYKAGTVSSACWKSQAEADGRTYDRWSTKIDNRYCDADGNWKSTQYYSKLDLLHLLLVVLRTLDFIAVHESATDAAANSEVA